MTEKKPISTNFEFLGKSRKKVKPGDIFVMKIKPLGKYLWGRVVMTDARLFSPPRSNVTFLLVYIYRTLTDSKDVIPELKKNNLIIPPKLINARGWLDGYFKTVGNVPIKENDIFQYHCFRDKRPKLTIYRNQYSEELPGATEPCGEWGIGNHRTIDDKVSQALGIPLAPEDEK